MRVDVGVVMVGCRCIGVGRAGVCGGGGGGGVCSVCVFLRNSIFNRTMVVCHI